MWDCDVIMQMCGVGCNSPGPGLVLSPPRQPPAGLRCLYLVLKSLVSCTNAIGPPLECTKQKITLKLYSSLELELTVTLQQSSETSKPILLLLYLRIYICIIFRPVPRAEARPRTGAMSVRRSSERHAHTSQQQHASHTHHQRSHSARHAR